MCSAAPRTFNKLWKFPKHKYPCWTASRTPCSRDQGDEWIISIRGGVQKKRFFWEIFPKCGWVGWLIPKQGPTPSKSPRKLPFSTRISTFVFPNLAKTLGWVGKHIWERSPPNQFFFFGRLPLYHRMWTFSHYMTTLPSTFNAKTPWINLISEKSWVSSSPPLPSVNIEQVTAAYPISLASQPPIQPIQPYFGTKSIQNIMW